MTDERNENWLERSLRSASAEVAAWPEWKRKAMRVLPEPEGETTMQDDKLNAIDEMTPGEVVFQEVAK